MKNKILIELGNNIRAERNRKHMSQDELANKIGVQSPHISKIENGHSDIKFTTLVGILKVLDLPFEKLFEIKK